MLATEAFFVRLPPRRFDGDDEVRLGLGTVEGGILREPQYDSCVRFSVVARLDEDLVFATM